jgi:hypothetical protein
MRTKIYIKNRATKLCVVVSFTIELSLFQIVFLCIILIQIHSRKILTGIHIPLFD